MEIDRGTASRSAAMQLAKASAFRLGSLSVDPSTRTVNAGARSETIEPRVMRVLVALGETPGHVLSRDELIELCWDGQIVGDPAINRAISLLRRVFEDLGEGDVRLETITKVGFRIVVDGAEQAGEDLPGPAPAEAIGKEAAPPAPPRKWTRRAAVAGAVLAGGALVYATMNRTLRAGPDPRARDLYERGQFLLKSGDIGAVRQAVEFNKQAVKIDPDYADAWGALAIGYVHSPARLGPDLSGSAAELARSAAERALSLDPDQPDAHLALAIPLPNFRRWLDHEKRLREVVRRFPDYWHGHGQLGILLHDVGRTVEAVEQYRRTLEIDPMLPNYWNRLAGALHAAGREQESDIAFDEAFARWPSNIFLRVSRVHMYFDSKRYAEAAAFLRNPRERHETAERERIEHRARMADALISGTGLAEQADVVRADIARDFSPDVTYHALYALAVGAVDLAFEALEATYFGGVVAGRRIAPPTASDQRQTATLFGPTMLTVRDDPRYAGILKRIGLEDYWRRSGARPDYRKG